MRFFSLLLIHLLTPTYTLAADLKPDLDNIVETLLKDKPVAGVVVGVWMDGKPQVHGYGKVTTAVGEMAPDGDTLFEIGSVTKSFTGVLLADAVARKEVALDDPVNKHLPADLQIKVRSAYHHASPGHTSQRLACAAAVRRGVRPEQCEPLRRLCASGTRPTDEYAEARMGAGSEV
jgi:CubicO group peptidase (beta-lactamase class C family)